MAALRTFRRDLYDRFTNQLKAWGKAAWDTVKAALETVRQYSAKKFHQLAAAAGGAKAWLSGLIPRLMDSAGKLGVYLRKAKDSFFEAVKEATEAGIAVLADYRQSWNEMTDKVITKIWVFATPAMEAIANKFGFKFDVSANAILPKQDLEALRRMYGVDLGMGKYGIKYGIKNGLSEKSAAAIAGDNGFMGGAIYGGELAGDPNLGQGIHDRHNLRWDPDESGSKRKLMDSFYGPRSQGLPESLDDDPDDDDELQVGEGFYDKEIAGFEYVEGDELIADATARDKPDENFDLVKWNHRMQNQYEVNNPRSQVLPESLDDESLREWDPDKSGIAADGGGDNNSPQAIDPNTVEGQLANMEYDPQTGAWGTFDNAPIPTPAPNPEVEDGFSPVIQPEPDPTPAPFDVDGSSPVIQPENPTIQSLRRIGTDFYNWQKRNAVD